MKGGNGADDRRVMAKWAVLPPIGCRCVFVNPLGSAMPHKHDTLGSDNNDINDVNDNTIPLVQKPARPMAGVRAVLAPPHTLWRQQEQVWVICAPPRSRRVVNVAADP